MTAAQVLEKEDPVVSKVLPRRRLAQRVLMDGERRGERGTLLGKHGSYFVAWESPDRETEGPAR